MSMHEWFDWKKPDYARAFQERADALVRLRNNPEQLPNVKAYYRDHPEDFISDWGVTVDPRNVEVGLPAFMPFVLFPKQREFIQWVMQKWRARSPGLVDKSRDMGITWLSAALAVTLCRFHPGVTIGFGSRKEALVDSTGDPDSILWKVRQFATYLPNEFSGGWSTDSNSSHLHVSFPDTGSVIKGEAGDNIGRGGRSAIYFVDEAAHIQHPAMVDAALSNTTNCRIDMSSVNGRSNPFAQKRFSWPADRVFSFHWRDDPRKDDAWHAKKATELDPITLAQEVDMDYAASVEGVVIPNDWVLAAVDAHKKLGLTISGGRVGALDVADEGRDLNAFCGSYGILIEQVVAWSGKGSTIFKTTEKAFSYCDLGQYPLLKFDSDGLGAGVRGDAEVINERRDGNKLVVEPFRGSAAVFDPEGEDQMGRKNKDFFANCKAQSWWSLRQRFYKTFKAVTSGGEYNADDLISLSGEMADLQKLIVELGQPVMQWNNVGKLVIDKAPEDARSPNLADAVVIRFGIADSINVWSRLAA